MIRLSHKRGKDYSFSKLIGNVQQLIGAVEGAPQFYKAGQKPGNFISSSELCQDFKPKQFSNIFFK